MKKAALIIQARMSSQRLPGKMTMDIAGLPLYQYVYRRCEQVRGIDTIIIATSTDPSDDVIANSAMANGIEFYRGSLTNVLERYIECARKIGAEAIVRVCGDSPFVDVLKAGDLLSTLFERHLDHIDFGGSRFVKGLDSEAVRLKALEKSLELSSHPDTLEHVTHFIRHNSADFQKGDLRVNLDPFDSKVALTVDTLHDLTLCKKIAEALQIEYGPNRFDFTSEAIFSMIRKRQLHTQ